MKDARISIITWDGGFRESFHTVDAVSKLNYPSDKFDFTWVEYYEKIDPKLREKLSQSANFRHICLNGNGQWHAGKCINAGIRATLGEIIVIIDGDVCLEPGFLHQVVDLHSRHIGSAVYGRRWDEPGPKERNSAAVNIAALKMVCRVHSYMNYGGCLTIPRETLLDVGLYEEHHVFGGPHLLGGELACRLRNRGVPIVWPPTLRVYHPWHENTLTAPDSVQERMQQWIIDRRTENLDFRTSFEQVDIYLNSFAMPTADPEAIFSHRRLRLIRNTLKSWLGNCQRHFLGLVDYRREK
jgi:GT2 family glycosyltransferase